MSSNSHQPLKIFSNLSWISNWPTFPELCTDFVGSSCQDLHSYYTLTLMRIFRRQIAKPWMERNTVLTCCSWISEGIWSDVTQKLGKKKTERRPGSSHTQKTYHDSQRAFTVTLYDVKGLLMPKKYINGRGLRAMRGLYANVSLYSSLTVFYSQRISAGLFMTKEVAMEIWGADRRVTILLYLCWILAVFWECFCFVPHWIIS